MELPLFLSIIGAGTGVIALIVSSIGTFLSDTRTRESNSVAIAAFDADIKAKEAEFIEKYSELIYRSSYGKEIIEACKQHKPILQNNGGSISERDLENFLNDLQHPFVLSSHGIVRVEVASSTFGWVIERIHDSPEILNYIQAVQTKYATKYWQILVDFKNNNGYK